jgi:acetyl-CoA carboxylase carboxyl transferase subunit alpha
VDRWADRRWKNLKNHLKKHRVRPAPPHRAAARNGDSAAAAAVPELTAIERVRLARNPQRPQTLDYVDALFTDFFEIHGDRHFADDGAIIAALARLGRHPVAIVGQQRGRTTAERLKRNFGKSHPEGYRKALRVYELADRFGLPLITFIDTQGAESGVGAEERGQHEAIARNLEAMARLEIPTIACVIGEGGSGGALALGVANRVLMQENACYSVITPEGCAAILWRGGGEENIARAAASLRLTARDLLEFAIIDEVVPEPAGGAHNAPAEAASLLGAAVARHLKALQGLGPRGLRRARDAKFAAIGQAFLERARVENPGAIG